MLEKQIQDIEEEIDAILDAVMNDPDELRRLFDELEALEATQYNGLRLVE